MAEKWPENELAFQKAVTQKTPCLLHYSLHAYVLLRSAFPIFWCLYFEESFDHSLENRTQLWAGHQSRSFAYQHGHVRCRIIEWQKWTAVDCVGH